MDGDRRSFADVPASLLVEALEQRLMSQFAVTRTDLLLIDYRLSHLLPLYRGDAGATHEVHHPEQALLGTAPGGAAWQAYDQQQPSSDPWAVYTPVTVRGDRIGVLRLEPATAQLPATADLVALGSELAHELAAARRTTDRYIVGARAQRLSLAAEMQWDMLPGRSCATDQFTLAGQLEPAYAVMGDTFDWTIGVDRLSLSVIDGMGEGVAAAALSSLANSALRNARRAGLSLEEQASLADSALHAQHRGTQYVSVLLLDIDLATGLVQGVDTGSPMLFRLRGDDITEVTLPTNEPLGMFDGSHYRGGDFQLQPNDRLVIVSDGVHAATTGDRQYAHPNLPRLLRRTRTMQPMSVVRTVVADLQTFIKADLDDDAAVMCLDWHATG
jgi:hypothetical protein